MPPLLTVLVAVSCATACGLFTGFGLATVIWRVPRGIPLRSSAATAVSGARITHRVLFGCITAGAFGLVTLWWLSRFQTGTVGATGAGTVTLWCVLLLYLSFAAFSITLSAIDIRHHRLPNSIVLWAGLQSLCCVTVGFAAAGMWGELLRALISGLALGVGYLVIQLCKPHSFGGGDVKLAPVIGLVLGVSGWSAVAIGTVAAILGAALWGLLLLLRERGGTLAFGPWMLAGAWVGILTSPVLID